MKAEKLFREIGQIDDEMIAEGNTNTLAFKQIKRTWVRRACVAAACVALTLGIVAFSTRNTAPTMPGSSELPMLTVYTNFGEFGFEGYLAYDIKELTNGNPWSESDTLTLLPVFQNAFLYHLEGYASKGLSADEMLQKAKEIASKMGLTPNSVYTNPTQENRQKEQEKERSIPGNENYEANATPYEAVVICGDVTIQVESNGAARIFFEPGVALPDGFTLKNYDATQPQATDATEYLLEQYAPLVAMQSPALDVFGDYTYTGQRLMSYAAYENSGSLTDRILGYNFNRVSFAPDNDNVLWVIDRHSADLSQKLGDYPIISAQKARELLLQKHYITTMPEELPDANYIASVELLYRADNYDEIFMPYYRFLVELPTLEMENGLKTFGAFYVPAVDERYITNMPLWDGSFS